MLVWIALLGLLLSLVVTLATALMVADFGYFGSEVVIERITSGHMPSSNWANLPVKLRREMAILNVLIGVPARAAQTLGHPVAYQSLILPTAGNSGSCCFRECSYWPTDQFSEFAVVAIPVWWSLFSVLFVALRLLEAWFSTRR